MNKMDKNINLSMSLCSRNIRANKLGMNGLFNSLISVLWRIACQDEVFIKSLFHTVSTF